MTEYLKYLLKGLFGVNLKAYSFKNSKKYSLDKQIC